MNQSTSECLRGKPKLGIEPMPFDCSVVLGKPDFFDEVRLMGLSHEGGHQCPSQWFQLVLKVFQPSSPGVEANR